MKLLVGLKLLLALLHFPSHAEAADARNCQAGMSYDLNGEAHFLNIDALLEDTRGEKFPGKFVVLESDLDQIPFATELCRYCNWGSTGTAVVVKQRKPRDDSPQYALVLNKFGKPDGVLDLWSDEPEGYWAIVRNLSCR